ncbi:nucleolar and coiled-body phosphoprotein 1-like [Triticum urartu]|uniref:nucleolar and coiled-body phosphoprotein 1-like n=1 Tax=Triticum urartu TaxID=4572 RepID=UPI002043ED6E|nr:nucleolar and coiled-body phosphoprotein 1-like [Triticum urartu]
MSPKRSAKMAAPPTPHPPPPPPASSEETGSRSSSEESEDAIADSPPSANTRAPPQKGEEDDESEQDESDDEEEEPVHAALTPKYQPPPQQQREGSESSDDEEEEEEEEPALAAPPYSPKKRPTPQQIEEEDESEEEEEEEEPAHAAPTAAPTTKYQPPPQQQKEGSESSDDEEEEEEEEEPTQSAPPSAPTKRPPPQQIDEEEEEGESEEEKPPKLAPKQLPEGVKTTAVAETKKPAAFSRIWSTDDEVRILEALAVHQKQHGTLPQSDALLDALAGKLDNRAYGRKELKVKVGTLKRRYHALSKRGELLSKEHDRQVLDLSKTVWGGDKSTAAAASVKTTASGHKRKSFEEMCELYPYLAEDVKELMVENPGMFKSDFGKMDHEKARVMNEKIKRQRVAQMKLGLRRHDLIREVTKTIIDLVD